MTRSSSPARSRNVRPLAAKLALAVAGVALGLALGELATRVAGGGDASMSRSVLWVFDRDAERRCRHDSDEGDVQPDSLDVHDGCNSQGLRDRENAQKKTH